MVYNNLHDFEYYVFGFLYAHFLHFFLLLLLTVRVDKIMEHKTWLWRKKSSEKTIVVSEKGAFSSKGNEREVVVATYCMPNDILFTSYF